MTRQLTHTKDIFAAFTGIGNLVCNALGGSLLYGLPSSHFDWALLWEPRDAAVPHPSEGTEDIQAGRGAVGRAMSWNTKSKFWPFAKTIFTIV